MTSKYIDNGAYATTGYSLSGVNQSVTIGPQGTIGGPGLLGSGGVFYSIVNAGQISSGSTYAIELQGGGAITNTAGGTIAGAEGIDFGRVGGYSVVVNAGTILTTGTVIIGSGGSNTFPSGVVLGHGGYVHNEAGADISGYWYGVSSPNGYVTTVANSGTISGGHHSGVSFARGTLTNAASGVIDSLIGVSVFQTTAISATVTNAGTIIGSLSQGVYANVESSGAAVVTNDAGALIEGAAVGVGLVLGGTLRNAGTVLSTVTGGGLFDDGVEAYQALITNSAGGLIEGTNGVLIGGVSTLFNAGTVVAGNMGVYLTDRYIPSGAASGNLTNSSGGLIQGAIGVEQTSSGSIGNAGIILGTGTLGVVVYLQAGTVSNSGTIEATTGKAIDFTKGGSIGNTAGGLIDGAAGIAVTGAAGTINNAGTILATGGDGVTLASGGSIGNSAGGLVTGTTGIVIAGAAGTVANSGIIDATGAGSASVGVYLTSGGFVGNYAGGSIEGYGGIVLKAAGTVMNAGRIVSSGAYAIDLAAGGSVLNTVAGIIAGETGVTVAGSGTIQNAGTIVGTSGVAVRLSSGSDVLVDEAGSVFVGTVVGGGGTLELAGSVGNLVGLGSSFTGFGTVDLAAGATWLANGANDATGSFSSAGTLIDRGILTLAGGGTLGGFVEGSGTLVLAGGTTGLNTGASLTVSNLLLSGGTATLGGNLPYAGSFNESAGDFLLQGHNLNLTGPDGFTGGTVTGTGYLGTHGTVGLSALSLVSGAVWTSFGTTNDSGTLMIGNAGGGSGRLVVEAASVFDLTGNGSITVASGGAGSLSNQALFEKTGGTGTSVIAASMQDTGTIAVAAGILDFTGSSNSFAGIIGGAGTIEFGGGANLLSSGAALNIGAVLIQGAGTTVTLGENLAYGGSFTEANGTTLALGADTLTLSGGSALAGTITGTGTLTLAAGANLTSGAALKVTHLDLTGGTLGIASSLTYVGGFVETGGTISLASTLLALTGTSSFAASTVSGTGNLQTRGATSLAGLTLAAGAVWQDYGTVTATGALTLGSAGGGSGRLVVEAGAVFDLTGTGGVAIASGGTASLTNAGLFEKTVGTGLGTVAPAISNTGTIIAGAGTLDFTGQVSGSGLETIGTSGTLEFAGSVASTQTIAFAGTTGGDLILDDPTGNRLGFAAVVSGFGGSDTLDLATFAFSGNPAVGWSQTSSSSGTLTITDGSDIAKIMLFGQYSQAGFGKGHDAGTGTVITYTPPTQMALAAPHH